MAEAQREFPPAAGPPVRPAVKSARLIDVCLLAAAGGLLCQPPPPAWPVLAVAAALALAALLPPLSRPAPAPGRLRRDRVLLALAAVLLVGQLPVDPAAGPGGWWPLPLAGLALAGGLALSVQSRRRGAWPVQRAEWVLALGLAALALGATAAAVWGVLAMRSAAGFAPGAVGWLDDVAVWTALYFALDARLRELPPLGGAGKRGWLVDRLPVLGILTVVALSALRAALA